MSNFLNITFDGGAGTAQGKQGTTISTFAVSLAAGIVLFVLQLGIFLVIRNYLWAKRIYQPRSFLVPYKQRVKPPHPNPLKWLVTMFQIDADPEVIRKAGLDAYFFLRYLGMCIRIFLPMALMIVPILVPLNLKHEKITTTADDQVDTITGLDTMAWSNITAENTDRYWGHLILAIGVVCWVCFTFHRELIHYIAKRQGFLNSPAHRLKASSTTVLIQDIPMELCNEQSLEQLYGDFPGGIRRMWINRNFSTLVKKDELRKKYENMLENAETNMIRKSVRKSRKQNIKQIIANKDVLQVQPARDAALDSCVTATDPKKCKSDLEYDLATQATWTRYITPQQRSTVLIAKKNYPRLARIPILGRLFKDRVDTIYYCRRELARLNQEIVVDAQQLDPYPLNGSAFIQFSSQKAAHLACQSVADTSPGQMRRRIIEISPADINWPSLELSWRARYFRQIGFLLSFALLILTFGFIAFFTGILSKASMLSQHISWLGWIASLPSWLLFFVQGTLPPVIQVVVLSGPLPILIRSMTNDLCGATTGQEGERSLLFWYFIFLIVELFLVPTVSSGLTGIIDDLIRNPQTVQNILATNLPSASNYYFSFLILQALSLSATSMLQTIRLFKYYVIGHVNTPKAVFEKLSWTNFTRIGSNIPWYSTFAVIGLVYSIIAPIMCLFVIVTFSLFWVVMKNNLLYCVRTGVVDGGGLWFPGAIDHLFVGLYFMQICLSGLFFLVRDLENRVACDTQGIIMALSLVLTFIYHIWLKRHFGPHLKYSPIRLELEASSVLEQYESRRVTDQVSQQEVGPLIRRASYLGYPVYKQANSAIHSGAATPHQMMSRASSPIFEEPVSRRPHYRANSIARSYRSQDIQVQQREDEMTARRILAHLNRPLDDTRLAHLEQTLSAVERRLGNVLMPRRVDIEAQMMNDPISKIIMQHNDELESLDPEERDMLLSIAFTHPILRRPKSCVWIPRDELGISDDEVRRTRAFSEHCLIDNRGAFFNSRLKVQVDEPPPDMPEFALIMAQL